MPHPLPAVLLVDDDDATARVLQRALSDLLPGVVIATVGGGFEALIRLRFEPYRAVILDVCLPGMTGDEVIRQFRREHVELPIVLVSGMHADDLAALGRSVGAAATFTKPVDAKALALKLRELLGAW